MINNLVIYWEFYMFSRFRVGHFKHNCEAMGKGLKRAEKGWSFTMTVFLSTLCNLFEIKAWQFAKIIHYFIPIHPLTYKKRMFKIHGDAAETVLAYFLMKYSCNLIIYRKLVIVHVYGVCGSQYCRDFVHRVAVFTADNDQQCWSHFSTGVYGTKTNFSLPFLKYWS